MSTPWRKELGRNYIASIPTRKKAWAENTLCQHHRRHSRRENNQVRPDSGSQYLFRDPFWPSVHMKHTCVMQTLHTCAHAGGHAYRHGDTQTRRHTFIHACVVLSSHHITSTVHDLPLVWSAVRMADAQSHVPRERSAKWVAKLIQGNFEETNCE